MRADLTLIAVAALATVFDGFVTTPSEQPPPERLRAEAGFRAQAYDDGIRVAQNVGPLATPALNPRLGSQPPGGHLGENNGGGRAAVVPLPGADTVNPERRAVPENGRLGPMDGSRLGPPPVAGAPNAPGAVPPPAAGAVQPPPGPNVPPLPAPAS